MLIFADRTRKAEDYPWLAWKVRVFSVGAVLAVYGMVQDDNRILAVATFILFIGFMMRFLPGGRGVVEGEEDLDEEEKRARRKVWFAEGDEDLDEAEDADAVEDSGEPEGHPGDDTPRH